MAAIEAFSKSLIEEVHKWGCLKQTGVSLSFFKRNLPLELLGELLNLRLFLMVAVKFAKW
ncbi:hypothetical protein TSUD_171890 [Trifolium subterraneum]|uniref:Uncharacterized protein n=1 Tax=Trifolium subterraneum TaxID=3900 RepID=A0A2Z6LJR4_TRISU|nr:hypothetical protein TSUD_171890 [Trifolium subterraneum]